MLARLWTYQKERFPLLIHGPALVMFCLATMSFSAYQVGNMPDLMAFCAAVFIAVSLFFQLRVADEHKDQVVDRKFRPERAVPRGLVTLGELRAVAIGLAVLQLSAAYMVDSDVVPFLLVTWLYMMLMSIEFFVGAWLCRTPLAYLVSHMLIVPVIALLLGALDWVSDGRSVPHGMAWILMLVFSSGLLLELGRKIRMPGDEQVGIDTYSSAWGFKPAVTAWWFAFATTLVAAVGAVGFLTTPATQMVSCIVAVISVTTLGLAGRRLRWFRAANLARWIEPASGIVTLIFYAAIAVVPLLANGGLLQ